MADEPVGGVAEENLRGRRRLLETRRGVDGVSGDEPLTGRGVSRDNLACIDAGPVADRDAPSFLELGVEGCEVIAHLGRRPDGPDRVVLVHARQPEDGHDRVADVLLDGAAVAFEGGSHLVEVPRHHLADGLGVELLSHRRRPLQVREDDRHGLPDLLRRELRS